MIWSRSSFGRDSNGEQGAGRDMTGGALQMGTLDLHMTGGSPQDDKSQTSWTQGQGGGRCWQRLSASCGTKEEAVLAEVVMQVREENEAQVPTRTGSPHAVTASSEECPLTVLLHAGKGKRLTARIRWTMGVQKKQACHALSRALRRSCQPALVSSPMSTGGVWRARGAGGSPGFRIAGNGYVDHGPAR